MDRLFSEERYNKPQSISESITAYLREAILNLTLKPGQKITEKEIADQLNVSRSPIREAFRALAQEELITISPYRKAVVADLSVQELEEIFEVRQMVELAAIDLIAKHDITDFEALTQAASVHSRDFDDIDISEYLQETTRFHRILVETSGNYKLCQIYTSLTNSFIRYQHLAASVSNRLSSSHEEHKAILEALGQKDYETAKDLLRKHFTGVSQNILDEIKHLDMNQLSLIEDKP